MKQKKVLNIMLLLAAAAMVMTSCTLPNKPQPETQEAPQEIIIPAENDNINVKGLWNHENGSTLNFDGDQYFIYQTGEQEINGTYFLDGDTLHLYSEGKEVFTGTLIDYTYLRIDGVEGDFTTTEDA